MKSEKSNHHANFGAYSITQLYAHIKVLESFLHGYNYIRAKLDIGLEDVDYHAVMRLYVEMRDELRLRQL